MQQHLPQQVIQRTDLSVQATSFTNNDMIKIVIVVQQIMTQLSEATAQ
jgi:hypothetical protein